MTRGRGFDPDGLEVGVLGSEGRSVDQPARNGERNA